MSLLNRLRTQGVLHFVETTFNRFVSPWIFRFSVGDVFELDVEKLSGVLDECGTADFRLEQVQGVEEKKKLREITWNSVPLDCSAEHFGFRIPANDDRQRVLGGVWGGVTRFVEQNLGFEFRLKHNEGWIYCAFVDQAARGKGIYKRVLSFACKQLAQNGLSRQLVVVQPWNKASTYIHRKYSKDTLGRIVAIRFFGLATVFCTGKLKQSKMATVRLESAAVQIST